MPDTPARPLWTAAEIAAATGGVLHGDDRPVTGLTYNSREIVPGDLFLALKGARDGHEFAASAFAAGAAAASLPPLPPGAVMAKAPCLSLATTSASWRTRERM